MKQLLVFLFSLLIACIRGPVSVTPSIPDLEEVTVKLVLETPRDGLFTFCGGTWVSNSEILTAAHCARAVANLALEEDPFQVEFHYSTHGDPQTPRKAKLVSFDEDHDLALLRAVTPLSHPVAKFGAEPVKGDRVYAIGHVNMLAWSFRSGDVAGVRVIDGTKVLHCAILVWKGDSGSGAFDASGNLVGVWSFIYTGTGQAFAIHLDELGVFLAQAHIPRVNR